jgi:dTDP-4-dehydrorhamnose 3,5-epimerase
MNTPILSKQPIYKDHRGSFTPIDITGEWIQSNISINDDIYTFRGLHFQHGSFAQTKLVKVIKGKIIDFAVNIDKESDDYKKVHVFNLDEGDEVLVPKGYAHGFITLQSGTIVNYLVDNGYSKENEDSILRSTVPEISEVLGNVTNGKTFKIKISDKDITGKNLNEL